MSGPPGSVQPDELERLLAAIDAAQLGTWEHDSASGRMLVSPRLEAMLGLPPGGFAGTFAALLEHVHPDDRACLLAHADEARRTRRDIHVEYRVVLPDGSIRWLEGRGRLRYDGDRELGSTGVVVDVTERRQEQLQRERLAAQVTLQRRAAELLSEFDVGGRLAVLAELLVPTLGDCCAVHLVEPDATIALAAVRHADASKQRWFGELLATFPVTVDQPYGAGAVIATGRAQLLPAVDDDLLAAATRDRPGDLAAFRALHLRSVLAVPLVSRGRTIGALSIGRTTDEPWSDDDRAVAEQLAAAAALAADNARLFAAEHAARTAAEASQRRLALLAEVTTTLAQSLDLDEVLDRLAGLLVPGLAELCTIDLVDGDRARQAAARSVDADVLRRLRLAEERLPRRRNGRTAVARAVATRRPVLVPDVDDEYLRERAVDEEQFTAYRGMGLRSALVAPMLVRDRAVGTLSLLGIGDAATRFTDDDAELLLEIGRRAALAIENARLYGEEHALAEALQRSLLPKLAPIPGVDVAARYLPSSDHAQVGGDWYDAFGLADDAVGIAVGDAMGHDPRASGAMGQLRSVLRSYAFEGAAPGVVLDKLDRLVQGFAMAQLATVFYARLQPTPHADGTGAPWTLRYASAGHPPPLVALPDGAIRTLDAALSPVIGAPSVDAVRPEAELALPSGAVLVGYTDGLVEGRRRPIDDGIDLLRGVLRRTPADATAEELCEAVLAGLVDDDREDDVAILVLRVR